MLKFSVTGPKKIDLPLEFQCPECRRKHSLKMRNVHPGKVIRCSCGAELRFQGDDPRRAQAAMDDLVKTIHKWGR